MHKVLPRDITLQVFYRLPIESILDCMLVCKPWLNIIKDPCFALKHVLYRPINGGGGVHDPGFILLNDTSVVYRRVDGSGSRSYKLLYQEYGNENQVWYFARPTKGCSLPPPTIQKFFSDCDFSEAIGSCNGLICLDYDGGNRISICNPITREYMRLPEFNIDPHQEYVYRGFGVHIGFGYHHSTNEYKVVRIFRQDDAVKRLQVYTLGGTSDGWRDKDSSITNRLREKKGVFANGEIYWLCRDRTIVAFNVADETLREFINLPPSMASDLIHIFLYELDGCLCAVAPGMISCTDVWILRKRGDDLKGNHTWSWSREFSVPNDVDTTPIFMEWNVLNDVSTTPIFIAPLMITKHGGLISRHGSHCICLYDPKQASVQPIGYTMMGPVMAQEIPHINSLVSLKALVGQRPERRKTKISVSKPKEGLYSSSMVSQILEVVMNKLSQTMDMILISENDRQNQGDQQVVLCGLLQEIIQILSASDDTKVLIFQALDKIVTLLLKVLGCSSSMVHRVAMLSMIRALIYATGAEFGKYMTRFYKHLEMGLQNVEEYQVFSVSVEILGDICRAFDEKILPFCNGIMSHLLTNLSSGVMHHPSVKPLIFSCFGDIATAIGKHFEKYVQDVMPMIKVASEICAKLDTDNEEEINYCHRLRCGIFEAYSGILQGLKNSKSELMLPHAGHLLQFIDLVFKDKMREERVSKAAVAAMGDLAHTLGPNAKTLFNDRASYVNFLRECLDSEDYKMKEIAVWTQKMIEHVFVCGNFDRKRRKLLVKQQCDSETVHTHLLPVVMNIEPRIVHPSGL